MTFVVPIRIDAQGVDGALRNVNTELDRTERLAKQAETTIKRAVQEGTVHWTKAAEAQRALQAELIKTERASERLAAAAVHTKGLFDGVLSGVGLAGIAGGAAGIAAIATTKIVELGRAVIDLGEVYTNLDNRLKSIAPNEERRLDLMERTRGVANASRADWGATNELFVRLSGSTKEMGISQERVLGLTETISKTFTKSGASAAEASAGMLQLSQAFASGKLQGDEFKSISESVPDVLDLIAKQMGVTRGELKKLSSEGAITGDVLVATFENAKSQIDEGFGRTAPTLSQSFAVFKNEMTATFGPLIQSFLPAVAAKLQEVAATVSAIADGVRKAKSVIGDVSDASVGGVSAGDVFGYANSAFNPYKQISKIESMGPSANDNWFKNQKEALELYKKMEDSGKSWIEVRIDEAQQLGVNVTAWGAYKTQLEQFVKTTEEISNPTKSKTAVEPWSLNFTALGDVLSDVTSKADALLLKLAGLDANGSQLIRGMFGAQGIDILDQLSAAGLQAEGGWAQTRRDPNDTTGKKKGGGRGAKAWEPDTNYLDNVVADLKNAAAALELFDTWADNSAEHFKFLLDLSEEARNKSVTGGVQAVISGDANNALANDPNALKPAQDVMRLQDRQAADAEVAMIRMQEQAQTAAEIMKTAFGSVENALVKLATTGEFSFKGMVGAMMADLARLAANKLIMSLIGALTPQAGFASVFGTGATQAKPGMFFAHGGTWTAPVHAADGGSWRIGGSSTVGDKVPFAAMVNSGENVTVTNRFQQAQQQPPAPSAPTIINQYDPRALLSAINTPDGKRAIYNVLRDMPKR